LHASTSWTFDPHILCAIRLVFSDWDITDEKQVCFSKKPVPPDLNERPVSGYGKCYPPRIQHQNVQHKVLFLKTAANLAGFMCFACSRTISDLPDGT
jgi:hypothetical protein